jgi:hypothetical protein
VQGTAAGLFREALAPHGEWFQEPRSGWAWHPRAVPPGWRPYTTGRWVYTEKYGFTWTAEEEWGWAAFHYGRWQLVEGRGWAWIPGTEWGPCWVAWRAGGGRIGWAALPPGVAWDAASGLGAEALLTALIEPEGWAFVEEKHFADPSLAERLEPLERRAELLAATRDATSYAAAQGHAANRSLAVEEVETAIGCAVPRHEVVERSSPAALADLVLKDHEIAIVRLELPDPEAGAVPGPIPPYAAGSGKLRPSGKRNPLLKTPRVKTGNAGRGDKRRDGDRSRAGRRS